MSRRQLPVVSNKGHERGELEKAKSLGLNVKALEDDTALQDAVLTVHHALIHTMSSTRVIKIIENHTGVAFLQVGTANP
jgi:hypothetical protein